MSNLLIWKGRAKAYMNYYKHSLRIILTRNNWLNLDIWMESVWLIYLLLQLMLMELLLLELMLLVLLYLLFEELLQGQNTWHWSAPEMKRFQQIYWECLEDFPLKQLSMWKLKCQLSSWTKEPQYDDLLYFLLLSYMPKCLDNPKESSGSRNWPKNQFFHNIHSHPKRFYWGHQCSWTLTQLTACRSPTWVWRVHKEVTRPRARF